MSYIDSYNHTHLGMLCDLPIYHPLEKLDDEGFGADKDTLIMGGGSGEHAILKITSLAYCIYEFYRYNLNTMILKLRSGDRSPYCPKSEVLNEVNSILESWWDRLDNKYDGLDCYSNLEYVWSLDDASRFNHTINQTFRVENYYYSDQEIKIIEEDFSTHTAERKLNIMLGSIILRFANHLLSEEDRKVIARIDALSGEEWWLVERFTHVFTPAISGWTAGGKIVYRDKTGKSVVKWGVSMLEEDMIFQNYDIIFNQ